MSDTLHAQPSGKVPVTIANPSHDSRGEVQDIASGQSSSFLQGKAAMFARHTSQPQQPCL